MAQTQKQQIAELKARLAEALENTRIVQVKSVVTAESIKPLKDKLNFFISPYPGAGFPVNNEAKDVIVFAPRSTVNTNPVNGNVTVGSIVGEFWTSNDALAEDLDAVEHGVRRMTDDEIVRCIDAQT